MHLINDAIYQEGCAKKMICA